jgi:hypothetical protein
LFIEQKKQLYKSLLNIKKKSYEKTKIRNKNLIKKIFKKTKDQYIKNLIDFNKANNRNLKI